MKKITYLLISIFAFAVFSTNVFAKTTMTNLKETISEELAYFGTRSNFQSDEIFESYQDYVELMNNSDLSNYTESDEKVNIYIFRGASCWHCLDETSWLASIYQEYGQYFNVHTYEVYNNKSNSKLSNVVGKFLGNSESGVPLTVIADQVFVGFGEEYKSQILDLVKAQYNSEEKYDIKNYIDLEKGKVIGSKEDASTIAIVLLIAVVVLGGGALIYFISKSN